MADLIMEIGLWGKCMAKVYINGQEGESMRVISIMISNMDTVSTPNLQALNTLVNSKMENKMASVS